MSTTAIIAIAALWLVVILLAVVVFALARQIGILHERIAPAGALTLKGGVKPGEAAPELEMPTLSGTPFPLRGAAARSRGLLLFFLSPTCPVCRTLLPVVRRIAAEEQHWLEVAFASDGGTREAHESYVAERQLDAWPYVVSQELGVAFGVGRLPYAVLLDASGILAAKGLVNTREHLESLLEAHRLGIPDINQYLARDAGTRSADAMLQMPRATNQPEVSR